MPKKDGFILLLFIMMGAILFFIQDRWLIRDYDDFTFSSINELVIDADGSRHLMHVTPVNSFQDAVKSQQAAYLDYNGRYVIHTLSQWFNGTKSDGFVACFNTAFWALLLTCFYLLSFSRSHITVPNMIIAFAVLWLTMPNALVMMLGSVTASADYLWTGAANLFILLLFERLILREKPLPVIGLIATVIVAFIVGAMQESFSIGISVAFVVYSFTRRKKMSRAAWLLVIFYVIGTVTITFAPANFKRSDMMGHFIRWYLLTDLLRVPVVSLMLLTTFVTLILKPRVVADVVNRNMVIVIALIVNMLFALLVAYTGPWQLTCISLFSAILLLQMATRLITGKRLWIALAIVAACCTVIVYGLMLWHRHEMWKVGQNMYKEALASNRCLINLRPAYDVDRPFRESRLAPLYRQYLRNPFEVYIINDQLIGVTQMSKHLTKYQNPDQIQALLPDSPEHIAKLFESGNGYPVGDAEAVELYAFTITRAADELADGIERYTVRQQWTYDGMCYKLYYAHGIEAGKP